MPERADVQTRAPYETGRGFRVLWALVSRLPLRLGSPVRAAVLRLAGARIGHGVTTGPGVRVLGPAGLVVDDRAGIARNVVLDARVGVQVGAGALIGFEAVVLTWTHRYEQPTRPIAEQGFTGRAISVGARSWVGARAVLLPGALVGDAAIVGAGAVVVAPVPSTTVVAGNPARHIRDR